MLYKRNFPLQLQDIRRSDQKHPGCCPHTEHALWGTYLRRGTRRPTLHIK